jgi:hypothetical protein
LVGQPLSFLPSFNFYRNISKYTLFSFLDKTALHYSTLEFYEIATIQLTAFDLIPELS